MRKFVIIFSIIFLILIPLTVFVSTKTIKHETLLFKDGSQPSTWKVAGFDNPEDFKNFYRNFQILVANSQKEKIAEFINYPLPNIKDRADFIKNYDLVFNKKVKDAVNNQNIDEIWRNYSGVMIGNGEIWFNQLSGEKGYWITAINY